VQHAGVVEHDERLVKVVVDLLWIGQYLRAPAVERCQDLAAQFVHGDGIDEHRGRGPGEGDALPAQHAAHHEGVAVAGTDEGAGAVVQVPEWRAATRVGSQNVLGEVGAFQVWRPGVIKVMDARVHGLQRLHLLA
jgi:hypothetical protein